MRHLTGAEFAEWLEGELPAARAAHLDTCAACRDEAASIRAVLTDASMVEWAEPSPLFWDHFGARVSKTIADEPPPATAPGWTAWLRTPAATWAAAAALAVLLMVAALWRATLVAPARPPDNPVAAAPGSVPLIDPLAGMEDLEEDAAWAVVRSAVDDLAWDDARAAGVTARPGSADLAIMELSNEERAELARLLEAELKRSGV